MSILLNTAITCTWIIIVVMTTVVDFSNVLKMIITFCTCLTVIVNYKSVKIFCVLLWLIIFSQWKFSFFSSPGQRWTFLIMNLWSLCIFTVVFSCFVVCLFVFYFLQWETHNSNHNWAKFKTGPYWQMHNINKKTQKFN